LGVATGARATRNTPGAPAARAGASITAQPRPGKCGCDRGVYDDIPATTMESSLDIDRDVKHALRMTSLFDITGF
jgi:hypothetical protein